MSNLRIKFSLVFNRKKQVNLQGLALVQIRAFYLGNSYYISTAIYIKPAEWNIKKQEINSKNPKHIELNKRIFTQIENLQKTENKYISEAKSYTFAQIKEENENLEIGLFLSFCHAEIKKSVVSESTKGNHLASFRVIADFEEKNGAITFENLSIDTIQAFELFCKDRNLTFSSAARHHQIIRLYINKALGKNLLKVTQYPYKYYRIKTEITKREALSPAQLQALELLQLNGNEQIVRDLFLIGCYTGLRFADIMRLEKNNLKVTQEITHLEIKAQKTGKNLRLPIQTLFNGFALVLLVPFLNNKKTYTNSYVNRLLKNIGEKIGFENLHFHISRHTFATILLNKGLDLSSVQKLLQHGNIATTQIYAEMRDETIQSRLELIFA